MEEKKLLLRFRCQRIETQSTWNFTRKSNQKPNAIIHATIIGKLDCRIKDEF